ncbi:RHS repeat domain-containing protein [Silvanigrella paludirubra]|uniref:RHS repeat domain-containing protein n=1 Tax=Silvanigrella paludirubra TaxID=2499159 RepID=UPI001386868B|nr:RHS repeat-associated core domain-containing protein [Silvanigrella paludirubra]
MIKDHVGSVSQVIDIDSHKIVERNASEPFGLARGIPLLSNSILASYKEVGNRQDVSLYTNPQSNMRDNWEGKSFEILGSSNSNELQGMRGTEVFAKGKFSASIGLSNMGVRTLDSARGVWLSPDLYMGRNLEGIVDNPLEANLFQYANNNPITNNDPTGMASWNDTKSKINDACNGKVSGGNSGHDMTKSPGNGGKNDQISSNGNDKGSQNSNGFKDFLNNAANTVKNYGTEISNNLSEMGARINSAISKPEMAACGFIAGTGLVSLSLGIGNTAAATGGAPFSAGLSLGIIPATTSQISSGFLMASSGLGCMSGLLFNAAMGGAPNPKEEQSREPKSLQDQMTLEAAKRGDEVGKHLDKIKMNDPRYKDMQKMAVHIESKAGKKTELHFVKDPKTGNLMDFKFKTHSEN